MTNSLQRIKEFFSGSSALEPSLVVDRTGKPTNRTVQVATAVLLVEVAAADREIGMEEVEAVCGSMVHQFGLADSELPDLVEIAVASRQDTGKIDEFISCVNDHFDERQRQTILAMIWKVILADGRVDKFEQHLAKEIQARFSLSDESAREARRMAADHLV